MAPSAEIGNLVDWVVTELRLGQERGMVVKNLFADLEERYLVNKPKDVGDAIKQQLWEALLDCDSLRFDADAVFTDRSTWSRDFLALEKLPFFWQQNVFLNREKEKGKVAMAEATVTEDITMTDVVASIEDVPQEKNGLPAVPPQAVVPPQVTDANPQPEENQATKIATPTTQSAEPVKSKVATKNTKVPKSVGSRSTRSTLPQVQEASVVETIETLKPFKCEKCGSRFKNKEGIIYHENKSQTTCNPNWTGPIRPPKGAKGPKAPKAPKPPKQPREPRERKSRLLSEVRGAQMAMTPETQDTGGDSDRDTDDSEASLIAFFEEANAARELGRGYRGDSEMTTNSFPITPDTSQSVPEDEQVESPPALDGDDSKGKEAKVLRELMSKAPHTDDPVLSVPADDNIKSQGCEDIILGLVQKHSGIFPGGRALWYAFVPVFIRQFSTSSVLPTYALCHTTVENLVSSGKLLQHTWTFQTKDNYEASRVIVTLPSFDLSASVINGISFKSVFDILKTFSEDIYPRFYVPSAFVSDTNMLKALRNLAEPFVSDWETGTVIEPGFEPSAKRRRLDRRTRHSSVSTVGASSIEPTAREERRRKKAAAAATGSKLTKPQKQSAAARKAERELQMWQQPHLLLQNPTTGAWGAVPFTSLPFITPATKAKTVSGAKSRRTEIESVKLQHWQQAPSLLQNPDTGTWNMKPEGAQQAKTQSPSIVVQNKNVVPSATTYLQAENGAWSVKPAGHGANTRQPPIRIKVKPLAQKPLPQPRKVISRRDTVQASVSDDAFSPPAEGGDMDWTPEPNLKGRKRSRAEKDLNEDVSEYENSDVEERPVRRRKTQKAINSRSMSIPMGDFNLDYGMDAINHDLESSKEVEVSQEFNGPFAPGTPNASIPFTAAAGQAQSTVKHRTIEPKKSKGKIEHAPNPNEMHKVRHVTMLSNQFAEFSKNSPAAMKELGLQTIPAKSIAKTKNLRGSMTEDEECRLIIAVVAIRSIAGGLDKVIDWVLVATLYKKFSLKFLEKAWRTLKPRMAAIDQYEELFQQAFLEAYMAGDVPSIDYDNLTAYPWKKVVKWAVKKLGTDLIVNNELGERTNPQHEWRKTYFKKHQAMQTRVTVAAAVPSVVPLEPTVLKRADDELLDDFEVAKSWARATALTPDDQYRAREATAKLAPRQKDVERATLELHNAKILAYNKGKSSAPGYRKYKPHFSFRQMFTHKNVCDEPKFAAAAKYKQFLDKEFASGKEFVRADQKEMSEICILALQGAGRIKLTTAEHAEDKVNPMGLRAKGVPRSASRKKNIEHYKFEVDIHPTDLYVYDNDNEIVNNALLAEPPRGGVRGEIPLWYSIHGEVIPEMWRKTLMTVVWMVHLREGSNVKSLHGAFTPYLEEWEIRRFMEWGESIGIFRSIMDGIEGWSVEEWWWIVVGMCCNESTEQPDQATER